MRADATAERIARLCAALGRAVAAEHTIYLVGGASAVVEGWRASTLDVDLRCDPDDDEILRALSELKHRLDINIETASPLDFLPAVGGWEERSPFVRRDGRVTVRHMDFRLQALAKLERASEQDLDDVRAMLARGLTDVTALAAALAEIEPQLFRFTALDAPAFVSRVTRVLSELR